MNIQGLKIRCEVQQDLINKWRDLAHRQEKLLRRSLLVIKCDEDPKLMYDIIREISAGCIE